MMEDDDLPDEVNWVLNEPDLTKPELPKPSRKYKLWDLILHQLALAERIDCWEAVMVKEGKCLDPFMEKNRDLARQTAQTLQLLEAHEREIVALIKQKKK